MHRRRKDKSDDKQRRGVTLVLAVIFLTLMLTMIAFAVDLGRVVLVRTELQAAADSSAMAAAASMGLPDNAVFNVADEYAAYHKAAGTTVRLNPADVELGMWDTATRTFTPTAGAGNAVRVTARADETTTGNTKMFFSGILNKFEFSQKASAVAMANPRDIAFVVDLSGSMNDDAEPAWATAVINDTFAPEGYPTVGSELMQQLYEDFGFGTYPGQLEYIGAPWGVGANSYAYYNLTKNGGPLTNGSVPSKYRIGSRDSSSTRKRKAYSAIIDFQIASVMPNAMPEPNSETNYSYWEKYLDYILYSSQRVPNQDSDRITGFNNPNRTSFPGANRNAPKAYQNEIGYLTYVQFMVDHGRDTKPDGANYVPLSKYSPYCPRHAEQTAGGTFDFPPRTQPMHAARRAIIAALQVVKERNSGISDPNQRDWVEIISFDRLSGGGPVVVQSLTGDYDAAMRACTDLQAVSDKSASTATEAGLLLARETLASEDEGGQGRRTTNKVVVMLTDGMPNLYVSSKSEISAAVSDSGSDDFYRNDYTRNAPLMQAMQMQTSNWSTFPVGVGLGTDYDFMDRLSRLGGTADENGFSSRGSGNPAEYEQRMTEIFEEIITNPKVRLVQ